MYLGMLQTRHIYFKFSLFNMRTEIVQKFLNQENVNVPRNAPICV